MTEWMTASHILFSEYPLCFMNLLSYIYKGDVCLPLYINSTYLAILTYLISSVIFVLYNVLLFK